MVHNSSMLLAGAHNRQTSAKALILWPAHPQVPAPLSHLHEGVIQAVCIDGVVHICHDLPGLTPGLEVPGDDRPGGGGQGLGQQASKGQGLQAKAQAPSQIIQIN
jgi:hypothetical protein